MEIRDYEELDKRLDKHLEEIKNHKSFDMGDIDAMNAITHTQKNICYLMEHKMGGSSFGNGMWNAQGSYGRMMYPQTRGMYPDDGMYPDSYGDRTGTHYVRGHYSRAGEESRDNGSSNRNY